MPTMVEEREPGVYVRSNQPDVELDFLWSDRERRRTPEQDRFHLGFFAAGALTGSLVTFGVCFFLFTGGHLIPTQVSDTPTIVEEQTLSPQDFASSTEQPAPVVTPPAPKAEKQGFALPFFGGKPKEAPAQPVAEPKARLYEVQSNDTLGSIAIKFYDSSAPQYIEKIQRANKMTDADTLHIGQRLAIPPKTY